MFKSKTLFVFGAGAGQEIGLPVGTELSSGIAGSVNFVQDPLGQVVSGDVTLRKILLQRSGSGGASVFDYYVAGKQIAAGVRYSRSIDEFINKHKDNQCIQYCAKLAIAQAIIEAERNSAVFVGRERSNFQDLARLDRSWVLEFVRILHDGLPKADIANILRDIIIISFNYDRSIEHVLYHTLQHSYGIAAEEAASALSKMQIIHPYGYLGKLPWQDARWGVPFGADARSVTNIQTVATRIKTFYEQLQEESDLAAMKSAVSQAERIVFLGFGFHPQNVSMLNVNARTQTPTKVRRIYATAFGESAAGCDAIRDSLVAAMGNEIISTTQRIHVHNGMRCVDLLKEYSRDLSGGSV